MRCVYTACIGALRGGAGRDQRIVVCFDLQSVGQQAFLPHVRALVRTNGVRVGGGGRGAGCVVWCRERWTPRRDLMKPSRGLLKPARCAVALVQLAVPTGGLLQAIEAADIKRALRGSGAWGEGSGLRWARAPARAVSSPQRPSQPGEWRTARNRCITCQRVWGQGCVPCQILLRLANTRQGKPGGRAAALCRGAAAARGVSRKSVQATATEHPSGAVPGAE